VAFITELTPEQIALIPSYRQKWQALAFSTERIDRQEAKEAILATYELLQRPALEIQFFDSLYAAAEAAKPLYGSDRSSAKIVDELQKKFEVDNTESIGHYDASVEYQLCLDDKYADKLEAFFRNVIDECPELNTERIDDRLWESVGNSLGIYPVYRSDLEEEFCYSPNFFVRLNWYAHKGAFFDFHFSVARNTLFQPFDEEAWRVYQQLVRCCGWIIPCEDICFASDRATQLLFDDENRLHAEGEAALKFADGRGLYAYHGVPIPEKYGKQSPAQWQHDWFRDETDEDLKLTLVRAVTASTPVLKSRYFREALEKAAYLGRLEIVRRILNIETFSSASLSQALSDGVWSRDLRIVQALVDAGATLNWETEGGTPLIAAARAGDLSIVQYLVEAGADPNMWIDDSGYRSPLCDAVYEGHEDICEYLLPFISDSEEIEYARQELPKAVIRKQRRENKQLQDFFNAVIYGKEAKIRKIVAQGFDINSVNEDGETALHDAADRGNVTIIRLLAELGADLNALNEDGATPLMAVTRGLYALQAKAMRTLIRAGADVNYQNEDGDTALSYAVGDGSARPVFINILLKAGARWQDRDIYNAAAAGHIQFLKHVLATGIDLDWPDADGATLLMRATERSQARVMRLLLRAGASVNVRNERGETALHFADRTRRQHPVLKKILLKAGATY